MTKTLETNGQTRKTLESQLDRLDGILDGLSEGLSEAVGLAVQEAVQAVLTEVLTNPALREQLRKASSPDPAPPNGTADRGEGGKGRLAALCGRVGAKLRSACRAGAGRLRQAGQAANWAWRLAGNRVRAVLLAGAGGAAAGAAYLARTSLAAAAGRLWGAATALAVRAWAALRRSLPAAALCGT